jgi:hypothetical protein
MQLARGELADLKELVNQAADGGNLNPGDFPERERNYLKTVDLLTGKKLFSQAWLEQ